MKKALRILMVALVCFLGACKQNKIDTETTYIYNAINKINVKPTYKYVIIIPGKGCNGCIESGEIFMKNHINNTAVLYVLTKIESLKMLQNRLGIRLKDYSNVYIDSEDVFNIPTDNMFYPCIIELKNGKLKNYEFHSPKNLEVFDKLKNKL